MLPTTRIGVAIMLDSSPLCAAQFCSVSFSTVLSAGVHLCSLCVCVSADNLGAQLTELAAVSLSLSSSPLFPLCGGGGGASGIFASILASSSPLLMVMLLSHLNSRPGQNTFPAQSVGFWWAASSGFQVCVCVFVAEQLVSGTFTASDREEGGG